MFNASNNLSPITQAELAYRADRARRGFVGSRRRRRHVEPFYGPTQETTGRAN